jgi:hypothetical protein
MREEFGQSCRGVKQTVCPSDSFIIPVGLYVLTLVSSNNLFSISRLSSTTVTCSHPQKTLVLIVLQSHEVQLHTRSSSVQCSHIKLKVGKSYTSSYARETEGFPPFLSVSITRISVTVLVTASCIRPGHTNHNPHPHIQRTRI